MLKSHSIKFSDLYPNKINRKQYFIYYTLIFAIMSVAVFASFLHNGKSLIWNYDGWHQHYKALAYYAKWLREIIRGVLVEHRLEISTFNFSIGYGSDLITTLHYYVIGDPLAFLSVLVPTKYMAYFYNALIILRLYLAGATFSLFCFYKEDQLQAAHNKESFTKISIMAGAFIYLFCGFALFAIRHPYFINPMIYFPLLLIGVEKIFDQKKPYMFIVMVFISAVSNFYFLYMLAVLTALYVFWQIFVRYSKVEWRNALKIFLKFIGCAALGVFMSAAILFPVMYLFFSDARSESNYVYDFFYSLADYENNISNFLSAKESHDSLVLGYAAISLICIFLLFIQRRHKDVKISFLVLTVMTLLPVFGSIMNGFSYVTNRWIWGYGFLIAYIVVLKWKSLFEMTLKEKWRVLLCSTAYFLICIMIAKARTVSACFAIAIMFLSMLFISAAKEKYGFRKAQIILMVSILANIAVNALFFYSPRNSNYISQFIDAEEMTIDLEKEGEASIFEDISDDSDEFYRYSGKSVTFNGTLLSGLHSTQFYWSMANGNITELQTEMALTGQPRSYYYIDMDSRTALSTLSNVRYYVQDDNLPYGFINIGDYDVDEDGEIDYTVCENEYYLPFGYTYDSYITRETYDALTPLEKQEALLQGCVIDTSENLNENASETEVSFTGVSVPYEISTDGGGIL